MDIKETLKNYIVKPIAYTGLAASIVLGGCNKKEQPIGPVETINGIVIRELYSPKQEVVGISGKRKIKDFSTDEYSMLVETKDKKIFCYIFYGPEGEKVNRKYDVNSEVKDFPTISLLDWWQPTITNKLREKSGLHHVYVHRIK